VSQNSKQPSTTCTPAQTCTRQNLFRQPLVGRLGLLCSACGRSGRSLSLFAHLNIQRPPPHTHTHHTYLCLRPSILTSPHLTLPSIRVTLYITTLPSPYLDFFSSSPLPHSTSKGTTCFGVRVTGPTSPVQFSIRPTLLQSQLGSRTNVD
jgi:hypothetical protein